MTTISAVASAASAWNIHHQPETRGAVDDVDHSMMAKLWKYGPFPASFFFILVFSIQLTVNKCKIFFANDWIRTADLWYRKWPLYQLSHTTTLLFFGRFCSWILIRFFGFLSKLNEKRGRGWSIYIVYASYQTSIHLSPYKWCAKSKFEIIASPSIEMLFAFFNKMNSKGNLIFDWLLWKWAPSINGEFA